jgi:hypothetical protein
VVDRRLRRRVHDCLLLILPLVTLLALFAPPSAQAAGTCSGCQGGVTGGSSGIDVDQSGGASSPGGIGSGGGSGTYSGVYYEYTYVPACADDRALDPATGFPQETDCQAAHSCPQPDQTRMHVARRAISGNTTGPWTYNGTACLGPEDLTSYDPSAAAAFALDYFQHLPLPAPGIHVQPSQREIVNLPVIVSADAPPAGHWTVNQAPFPTIAITGTPHWTVDFGDGTTLTSDTPGRSYDGTDPAADPGHYLAHAYAQPAAGQNITVTVTWTATFTLGSDPANLAMNGTVTRTSSTSVPIDEAESLLTGNG